MEDSMLDEVVFIYDTDESGWTRNKIETYVIADEDGFVTLAESPDVTYRVVDMNIRMEGDFSNPGNLYTYLSDTI